MLLQTNSYVVPKEKRAEHARLVRKFRQTLARLGCDQFDVFEQVGPNWGGGETTGRFVQMMRFRDRKHQVAVQTAEKQDAAAQQLIQEFCDLINFGYQQQQGLFAVGYYQSVLPVAPMRMLPVEGEESLPPPAEAEPEAEPTQSGPQQHPPETSSELGAAQEWDVEPYLDMGMEEDLNNTPVSGATEEHLGPDDLDLEADLSDLSTHDRDEQRPPHA